jgi:hypothetical protein
MSERHEGDAPRRGADDAAQQEQKQPQAGNGNVKDSPDELSPEGLGSDELALRRMLHEVVQDVEPRDGTLEHLRRAVPARRARKRQAAVGMAAAALFLGTAVPALVHVSNSAGPGANPSIAGHGSAAQGGASEGKGESGGKDTAGGTGGRGEDGKQNGDKPKDPDKGGSGGSGSDGGSGTGGGSAGSDTDLCTSDQLSASGIPGAPDSMGTVYGGFRVTNVSGDSCTVGGSGSVMLFAQGAADPGKISLATHVAGDAAAGLPDPSLEVSQLVLLPGAAYEVRFAWVPSETCPTEGGGGDGTDGGGTGNGGGNGSGSGGTDGGGSGGTDGGGTGGPTPTPTPTPTATETETSTSDGATATDGGTETGTSPQLVTEVGTADGSVAVSYAAEPGAPGATVTVPNACAGTVYRTGMISGS